MKVDIITGRFFFLHRQQKFLHITLTQLVKWLYRIFAVKKRGSGFCAGFCSNVKTIRGKTLCTTNKPAPDLTFLLCVLGLLSHKTSCVNTLSSVAGLFSLRAKLQIRVSEAPLVHFYSCCCVTRTQWGSWGIFLRWESLCCLLSLWPLLVKVWECVVFGLFTLKFPTESASSIVKRGIFFCWFLF